MKSSLKVLQLGQGSPLHPIFKEVGIKNYVWNGTVSLEQLRDWKGYDYLFFKVRDYHSDRDQALSNLREILNQLPEEKRPDIIPVADSFTSKELDFIKERGLYEFFDFYPENNLEERFSCFYKKIEVDKRRHKEFRRIRNQTTSLKTDNRDLKRLSLMDDLTGLHNTRYMKEIFEGLFELVHRYERPLSVLMLDLDHFKDVNDKNNHLIGSTVLKEIGRVIKEHTRKSDVRIRYGGDEFVVIMPETPAKAAMAVAERIRKKVSELAMTVRPDYVVKITASLGVASLDRTRHQAFWELLRDADMAMYEAKKHGRNKVCLYDGQVKGYDTSKSSFSTVMKQILDVDSNSRKVLSSEVTRYLAMIKKGEI